MGGSSDKVLSITFNSNDITTHHTRLSLNTTPSLVKFLAAPTVDPEISEGDTTIILYLTICAWLSRSDDQFFPPKVPPVAIVYSPYLNFHLSSPLLRYFGGLSFFS